MFLGGPVNNMSAWDHTMAWRRLGRQAIVWTNADPANRREYAAITGDELILTANPS